MGMFPTTGSRGGPPLVTGVSSGIGGDRRGIRPAGRARRGRVSPTPDLRDTIHLKADLGIGSGCRRLPDAAEALGKVDGWSTPPASTTRGPSLHPGRALEEMFRVNTFSALPRRELRRAPAQRSSIGSHAGQRGRARPSHYPRRGALQSVMMSSPELAPRVRRQPGLAGWVRTPMAETRCAG